MSKAWLINDDYHPVSDEIVGYIGSKPMVRSYGWPDAPLLPRKKTARAGTARRKLIRLIQLQSFRCFHCGGIMSVVDSNVDHVMPLSKGGSRAYNNLVASHKTCNTFKADRLPTSDELLRLSVLHKEFKR